MNKDYNRTRPAGTLSRLLRCFVLMVCLMQAPGARAQVTADSISKEIDRINQAYDSAFYLTFDVRMTYKSDTLWAGTDSADFRYSELSGNYTFHRKNAFYKLGSIEYLQNDSFTVAVYRDEKSLLVGRPSGNKKTGSFLPTRALVDTAIQYILSNYTYSMDISNPAKFSIILTATDTLAVYEKITIEYEPKSHYLSAILYRVKDAEYDGNTAGGTYQRKADLVFLFNGYRVQEAGPSVFDERRYLFYDGPGHIVPADAYRDFTIYKNF